MSLLNNNNKNNNNNNNTVIYNVRLYRMSNVFATALHVISFRWLVTPYTSVLIRFQYIQSSGIYKPTEAIKCMFHCKMIFLCFVFGCFDFFEYDFYVK